MKKIAPLSTLDELLVPNRRHKYFDEWQAHPFKSDAEGFELFNSWWLAELSLLAYGDAAFIDETLEASGLKGAGFAARFFESGATQCFVLNDDKTIIVAFRGTQVDNFWAAILDVVTDSRFILVSDGSGGNVHQGFQDSLFVVWTAVRDYLNQLLNGGNRTLWFTGHSLGGALATLAADRAVRELGCNVQGLYTYGSPRVGDGGFGKRFAAGGLIKNIYRFINNSDIIARVPPEILYTHVGATMFIDNAGRMHSVEDKSHILPRFDLLQISLPHLEKLKFLISSHLLKGKLKVPAPGFLTDHAPIYYAIHLWNSFN